MTLTKRRFGLCVLLLTIAFLFASRLYLYAPWTIDRFDFLVRPLALVTLPLIVLGLVTARTRHPSWWVNGMALFSCIPAALLLWLQQEWPRIDTPTGYRDAYEALFVLEAVMYSWGVPLWIGAALTYIWAHLEKRFFESKRAALP